MKSITYPIFACFLMLLVGCGDPIPSTTIQTNFAKSDLPTVIGYEIVVINGCEYLATQSAAGHYALTHKGNCKNHIHPYDIEEKSLQARGIVLGDTNLFKVSDARQNAFKLGAIIGATLVSESPERYTNAVELAEEAWATYGKCFETYSPTRK
jgi:hypothetical protein